MRVINGSEYEDSLRCADLHSADLSYANLRGADLRGAHLQGAYLWCADLQGANLRCADLQGANLQDADLQGADLQGANLQDANLRCADLQGANFQYANLQGAKGLHRTYVAAEGDLIGWKKCKDRVIVKLRIPANAARSNATGRKCRAEYVEVLEVFGAEIGLSKHDGTTTYRAGKTVRPDSWCSDRWQECAPGIHFFITREEAEDYP
jgi:Family of unknown function (DUF5758)/Pentapeptide repeats (8 copies)